jgi:hypothetical protein
MKHAKTIRHLVLATISAALAVPALAQERTDPRIGQVNTRVGGELYGHNSDSFNLQPYQTRVLPSEERFAIERSGVLPSELQMSRTAAGPLTPNGILDYLPRQSPLQRAMGLPEPQLFNPGYNLSLLPSGARQDTARPGFDLKPEPTFHNNAETTEQESRALPPIQHAAAKALPRGEVSTGQLPTGQLSSRPESLPPPYQIVRPIRRPPASKQPSTQPTPPPAPNNK